MVIHLAQPAKFGLLVRAAPWAAGLKLELNKQPVERPRLMQDGLACRHENGRMEIESAYRFVSARG